jgi:hypothetical protein
MYFMFLFCATSLILADEPTRNDAVPSIEFLEFLGEWQADEDEWLDPITFQDDVIANLIDTTIEMAVDNEN